MKFMADCRYLVVKEVKVEFKSNISIWTQKKVNVFNKSLVVITFARVIFGEIDALKHHVAILNLSKKFTHFLQR